MRRVALYTRVSTDNQTTENQERELRQIAERRGWDVVHVYTDNGISGAKGRKDRPGLDAMLKDAQRKRFDLVACWAIDRLGRSLVDLLGTIQHLEAVGVDLFIEKQNMDPTTPAGKLMFSICGAFSEFERSIIQQRIRAGLARARAKGVKVGRPKVSAHIERQVRHRLGSGNEGIVKIARSMGIGTGVVVRIKKEMNSNSGHSAG